MYKKEKLDGSVEYTWKQMGSSHDALDAIGQALATYASMGFSTRDTATPSPRTATMPQIVRRKRVRIV